MATAKTYTDSEFGKASRSTDVFIIKRVPGVEEAVVAELWVKTNSKEALFVTPYAVIVNADVQKRIVQPAPSTCCSCVTFERPQQTCLFTCKTWKSICD